MAPASHRTNTLLSLLSQQLHLKPDILVFKWFFLDWDFHRNIYIVGSVPSFKGTLVTAPCWFFSPTSILFFYQSLFIIHNHISLLIHLSHFPSYTSTFPEFMDFKSLLFSFWKKPCCDRSLVSFSARTLITSGPVFIPLTLFARSCNGTLLLSLSSPPLHGSGKLPHDSHSLSA